MAWRTDAALKSALNSLQVFKEIHGEDGLINLLEQELAREHVLKQRKQTSDLQDQIDLYADALDFYGNADNYRGSGRNKPSTIEEDKGHKARRALAKIAYGHSNGEPEENGDD